MSNPKLDAECVELRKAFNALGAEGRRKMLEFVYNLAAAQRNGNSDLLHEELRRAERLYNSKPITRTSTLETMAKREEIVAFYARDTGHNPRANSKG